MTVLLALLLLQAEEVNSVGIKLVRIEPGEFIMGEGAAPPRTREEWQKRDADESPAHPVKITRAFLMGATEVTCAQYRAFKPDTKGADLTPVANVTWDQALEFCEWLSKKEGKPYRLPTEAEWEYACRAGGEAVVPEHAVVKAAKTIPAGSSAANAWGLHEMQGNVAEWCLDWYGPYEAAAQSDPVGRADGIARVTRGGHFLMGSQRYARAANRSGQLPDDAHRATGFRVVQGERPSTPPLPAIVADPLPVRPAIEPMDSAKPFFIDYTKERKTSVIPKNTWGPIFSEWNHFSAVCVCPNGDVLAAWYTTVSEEGRELAQASSRLPAGSDRWEDAQLFLDVPDVNDHAPVLLVDGKRIYHFFTQSLRGWDDASDCVRSSDDNGVTWSKPRVIVARTDVRHLSQPCSALVASDGTLVLACDGDGHRDERLVTSQDGGKTWAVAEGDMRKGLPKMALHPAIVRRSDGAILSFMRGPDPMPMLVTKDLGKSWEAEELPFPGISVGQKAAALRLASGAILLLSFDQKKTVVGGGIFAALSLDEGKTWPHVRKVVGLDGYLSLAQSPDRRIHAFGSRMSSVAFNEAWIKADK